MPVDSGSPGRWRRRELIPQPLSWLPRHPTRGREAVCSLLSQLPAPVVCFSGGLPSKPALWWRFRQEACFENSCPCISGVVATKYPDIGWPQWSFILPLISQLVGREPGASADQRHCQSEPREGHWGLLSLLQEGSPAACQRLLPHVCFWALVASPGARGKGQGPGRGRAGPRQPPTATRSVSVGSRAATTFPRCAPAASPLPQGRVPASPPQCLLLVVSFFWTRGCWPAALEKRSPVAIAGQSLGFPGPAQGSPQAATPLPLQDGGKKYLVREQAFSISSLLLLRCCDK